MTPGLAWSLNLPLLALAAWVLHRHTAAPFGSRWYWPTLLLRLGGGVALGLFYQGQFPDSPQPGGDTFTLHRQAAALTGWAADHFPEYLRLLLTATTPPGGPSPLYAPFSNSFFFVRLLSLLNWLTGSSYWLNGLWLSLGSFAGCWLLARELARLVPGARWGALVGCLLWPSVVFWGAGVGKDALLLGSLGLLLAAALRLIYPPNTSSQRLWWLLLLSSAGLFWKVKFFLAAVAFVMLGALAFTEKLRDRWPQVRAWQLFLGLAIGLAPLSRLLHRAFRPEYLLYQLPHNQEVLRAKSVGQPQLLLPVEPTLTSLLLNSPAAALGVFTRPWPWEGTGLLWRAVGLENAALLVLAVVALAGWWGRGRPLGIPVLAGALLAFVLVVAVMLGLSTPNLGTLYRYRIVVLPITLWLLAWLAWGRATPPSDNLGRSSRL